MWYAVCCRLRCHYRCCCCYHRRRRRRCWCYTAKNAESTYTYIFMIISISPSSIVFHFSISHSLFIRLFRSFFSLLLFFFHSLRLFFLSWLDLRIHFHFYYYYYDCNHEYNEMKIIYSHLLIEREFLFLYKNNIHTLTYRHTNKKKQHFVYIWFSLEVVCMQIINIIIIITPREKRDSYHTFLPLIVHTIYLMEMQILQFFVELLHFKQKFTVGCENVRNFPSMLNENNKNRICYIQTQQRHYSFQERTLIYISEWPH